MSRISSQQALISAATVLAALLIAASLVVLVPVGEAPDEPAHLTYVDHIVRDCELPAVSHAPVGNQYESHQPPLAYVVMALSVRIAGFSEIGFEFVSDPEFKFQHGARAVLVPAETPLIVAGRKAARIARASNLIWLIIIEVAILMMCSRIASSPAIAIAAAMPFCFAPQLLFTCSTANNDGAVIAMCSIAILGMFILAADDRERLFTAAVVSIAAGFALWSKVSAVLLVPGIIVVAVMSIRSSRWRRVIALLLPGCLMALAWVIFSMWRVGSVLPLPSDRLGSDPGGLFRLLIDPTWVVSMWGGFWAKLGWFNLPLPSSYYLAFLPPSLAFLFGFCRSTSAARSRNSANLVLVLGATANLLMLVAYMVRVDWQPQGRYLLPSVVAVGGLGVLGLEQILKPFNRKFAIRVALTSAIVSVAVAVLAVYVVVVNYS